MNTMTKSRNIPAKRKHWTPVEIELLRRNYADTLTRDIAQVLGRTQGVVYRKANDLGLFKSRDFIAEAPGDMAKTQFKKGREAHEARNYRPIGSLRLSKDGCLERKVTDDPSLVPARRWVGVHRLVWMQAHGPIPEGHAVVFKPGRRTAVLEQITPDAVECISQRELMARNTVHNLPKELVELVQLRGALNRQINKRSKTA